MKHVSLILTLLLIPYYIFAQKEWRMEAEDPASRVSWQKDGTADIIAPKGLTLWNTNLMQGDITIDYDARIVVSDEAAAGVPSRLSDLNCFWLATDPGVKNGSVFTNLKKRNGVFVNQYALQMYYLGYGGNHNSTTRFRRYDGDKRGITDASYRPSIIREYTDEEHLLKPNHWYHIHIEQHDGHVRYAIDGKTIVDYVDIQPLRKGYFGFRTTLSHAQFKNFTYTCSNPDASPVVLRWLNTSTNKENANNNVKGIPQTFSIPFAQGELPSSALLTLKTDKGETIAHDSWTLASWPDGSVKWKAMAAVIPSGTDSCMVEKTIGAKSSKKKAQLQAVCSETASQVILNNGSSHIYIAKNGGNIIDSIVTNGIRTAGKAWLEYNGKRQNAKTITIESLKDNKVRSTVKIDGECFTLRLYAYKGSDEIKMVHTLIVDSAMNKQGISSLGLRMEVPLRDADYKRAVVFDKDNEVQYMHVKPLIARRPIRLDEAGEPADSRSLQMVKDIASWDGLRLSQLSPNAFSIRKRATDVSPWIGTIEGQRAPGAVAVGDTQARVSFSLEDFWQSYPSTLQIDGARGENATVSLWLWSPEAEAMSFEHYDTIAHTLDAAYEDIQPGMSTAFGIARTSVIYITPTLSPIQDYENANTTNTRLYHVATSHPQLLPTPDYLHRKRAFGIWSMPSKDEFAIEETLDKIINTYENEIEKQGWYGYFNYGDVMHSYDGSRGEWRYDVGGYAWDNTELSTNAMFWYMFLRTGKPSAWRMAVAMSRHTSEVDCYHAGPHAGLGSRHNVIHWGCGAKEARISQAFWNRFLYYLTADERSGDLMREVVDADQLLYTLDPMRLAQPRSEKTPCTAPARLRVGPDWLAYAGNWFTEWERTGNTKYRDKIMAGMNSIATLPHGLFSGPKALGYDPATGVITWEGDSAVQNTNHLLSIMGGFEMMNEMLLSMDNKAWSAAWLEHAADYKRKALEISRNNFRIPRLAAYAYWKTGKEQYKNTAFDDLLKHNPFSNSAFFFTNDAATWTLDAIFMKEVFATQQR